jgi:hypothetical protein
MASKKPQKTVPHNEPTAERRSAAEVLQAARQMLANAQLGLRDIESPDPTRRIPGLHNVAVFGRAVTIALQRLRSIVEEFDGWYRAQIPENDPLLTFFNNARNEILKEARSPQPATHMCIKSFNGNPAQALQGPPPEGATGFFIGEGGTGGSGWDVTLPGGTKAKYYAALSPAFNGSVTTHLPQAPREFLGEAFTDTTVASVAGRYVKWLEELLGEAERRFVINNHD